MKKSQRLTRTLDFKQVYENGERVRMEGLVIFCKTSSMGKSHLGVVVSRKMGPAVARNRFKRRVRACFDQFYKKFPQAIDWIVQVRQPAVVSYSFGRLQVVFDQVGSQLKFIKNEEQVIQSICPESHS